MNDPLYDLCVAVCPKDYEHPSMGFVMAFWHDGEQRYAASLPTYDNTFVLDMLAKTAMHLPIAVLDAMAQAMERYLAQ